MEAWQVIVAVIAAGFGGVLATAFGGVNAILKKWFAIKESKVGESGRDQHLKGIKQIMRWHEIVETIQALGYVDRVLVFVGNNGGGVPRAGKPYYVRCTGGWSEDGTHPERMYAGPLALDSAYMQLLAEAIEHSKACANTEAMPPNAMLKKYYMKEGVVESWIFVLDIDTKELIYCSIASYKAVFEPHQLAQIEMVVDQVRGLMSSNLTPPAMKESSS